MKHFKHRLKIKFIKFKNVFLLHHSKKRILYFHAICSLVKTIEMGHKEKITLKFYLLLYVAIHSLRKVTG